MEFITNILEAIEEIIKHPAFYILGVIPFIATGIAAWRGRIPWERFAAAGFATICILGPAALVAWFQSKGATA